MEKRFRQLTKNENVRENLSALRQMIKDGSQRERLQKLVAADDGMWISFLNSEDPKTRKNAALLLGELEYQKAEEPIFQAYRKEEKLFVKSAYLTAILGMDVREKLPALHERLKELTAQSPREEEQKHIEEEIRALRKILIRYEGIAHHTFAMSGKAQEILLVTNRMHREVVRRSLKENTAELHPLGVLVKTNDLDKLSGLRTYRELLFVIHTAEDLPQDAKKAAKLLVESDLPDLLKELHQGEGAFYFRVECRGTMDLEQRSIYTRKLSMELERLSGGELVNSTTDYEIEIRLVENREGAFFPCLKCYTLGDSRFSYRKNVISSSIHPSTAALIMELAKPYLKEGAQIIDPFCGVGTMLIERHKSVAAGEIYATDIFGEAVEKGRENAALAGVRINFIHRDFLDFKHDYPFDEIVTNMPVRGKKTKEEMEQLYAGFFKKIPQILAREAVVVMYTNEIGFVKKQLRLHKEFSLLQETCMQKKNGFYLLIIGIKR